MRNLPIRDATKHFVTIGVSGSGKTSAINLFLQSIAPRFIEGRPRPEQLIIFDAKSDIIPKLAALGHSPYANNVWILNPFDTRSVAWNIAEAVQSPGLARQMATLMIPEEPNSTARYFSDASRQLVYAAILALNRVAGTNWTLRDLLCSLESLERMHGLTSKDPRALSIVKRVSMDNQHLGGVIANIVTKLDPFSEVAALWSSNKNTRQFNLREFLKHPGVLVLGNDPRLKASLWPLNALLLQALTQEILVGPKSDLPRFWFLLDEFRAMEKLDCIHDLLNRGRSKGVSVMLGIQTIEGLREIYKETGAEDILAQCAHKTFLRAGAPISAEWAERYFGKTRYTEATFSESWSRNGDSNSAQYNIQERSLLISSYFLNLPFPGPGTPYVAVHDTPSLRHFLITERRFDELIEMTAPDAEIDATEARPPKEQELKPWSSDEERYFCGEVSAEPPEPESETPPPRRRK